jgi:hypothetical protein
VTVERDEKHRHTLFINTWNSVCGNCGFDADPTEERHTRPMGYAQRPGCGIQWRYVSTGYTGLDGHYDRIKAMRPDLEFFL